MLSSYRSVTEIHSDLVNEYSQSLTKQLMKFLKSQSKELWPETDSGISSITAISLICIIEKLVVDESEASKYVFIDPLLELNNWYSEETVQENEVQDSFALREYIINAFEIKGDDCELTSADYGTMLASQMSQAWMDTLLNEEINQICMKLVAPFVESVKALRLTYVDTLEKAGFFFNVIPSLNPDAQIAGNLLTNCAQEAIANINPILADGPKISVTEDDLEKLRRELMYYLLFQPTDRFRIDNQRKEVLRDFAIFVAKYEYDESKTMHQVIIEESKAFDTVIMESLPNLEEMVEDDEEVRVIGELFDMFDSFSYFRGKIGKKLFDQIFGTFLASFETHLRVPLTVH
jgi:hypothetical protein